MVAGELDRELITSRVGRAPLAVVLGPQQERALGRPRILGCDHDERPRQRHGHAVGGDLPFLHGFEQRGLRARRGAVELAGQHDVPEERTGPNSKLSVRWLQCCRRSRPTQQIGRELKAAKPRVERVRQRFGQQDLAGAGTSSMST
jgi:hypothetical protein